MLCSVEIGGRLYRTDLSRGVDLSIPMKDGRENALAWGLPQPDFSPFRAEGFSGSTQEGGPVNCYILKIAPHGNGTHTESVRHISHTMPFVNQCRMPLLALAQLITVEPELQSNGDRVITEAQLRSAFNTAGAEALVVRSLPNDNSKVSRDYLGTNPPYFEAAGLKFLREAGVKHLLTDLPSVDREHDNGVLAAHHAYWNFPENPRRDATITELVYVPKDCPDGWYLLNLQFPNLETDAAPSRPVLYPVIQDQ